MRCETGGTALVGTTDKIAPRLLNRSAVSMDVSPLLPRASGRWLVTGAAGFIGSHLIESLLLAGQDVVGVDNFVTGKRENLEAVRTSVGKPYDRFGFFEEDLCGAGVALRAMHQVDYVLHQAALGSVPRSLAHPLQTYDANVSGFMNVLAAAKEANVRSFVFASSSSVYGDHPALPKQEDRIGNALSPYAASKVADELFAGVFSRCYGMRTVGLRYFNVFGPRQDPDGAYAAVIPRWCAAMLRGEPVRIHGDGESSRDFCYIDNVVQANIRAALSAPNEPGGTVLNIAVGEQTTLLKLFELLRSLLAARQPAIASITPVFEDFRPGDVRHSLASIEKARRSIGYEPTHSLEEGLKLAIDWYRGQATG